MIFPVSPGQYVLTATNNTNDLQIETDIPETVKDLDVVETVTIEREFDKNGNVTKETRTVSKPRVIPRDLPPRTPLRPEKPFRDIGHPETPNEPYTAPQRPYTKPWDNYPWNPGIRPNTNPYWTDNPPVYPGQPQIWCGSPPPQSTYSVTYAPGGPNYGAPY